MRVVVTIIASVLIAALSTGVLRAQRASQGYGESPDAGDSAFVFQRLLPVPFSYFETASGQFSKDGLEYYFTVSSSEDQSSLYVMRRAGIDAEFSDPVPVGDFGAADTFSHHIQPSLTGDARTLVAVRGAGNDWDNNDLFIATRADRHGPFTSVRPLTELNDAANADAYPWISRDGLRLYFTQGFSIVYADRPAIDAPFVKRSVIFSSPDTLFLSAWFDDDERTVFLSVAAKAVPAKRHIVSATRTKPGMAFGAFRTYPELDSHADRMFAPSMFGNELYVSKALEGRPAAEISVFNMSAAGAVPPPMPGPGGGLDIRLAPNPVLANATADFTLPNIEHARITVVDAIGTEVVTIADEHFDAGGHRLGFSTSKLPAGVYFVRLVAGSEMKITRLLVVR